MGEIRAEKMFEEKVVMCANANKRINQNEPKRSKKFPRVFHPPPSLKLFFSSATFFQISASAIFKDSRFHPKSCVLVGELDNNKIMEFLQQTLPLLFL